MILDGKSYDISIYIMLFSYSTLNITMMKCSTLQIIFT